jgi:RNA polymerase sigma-70 factor (ECF subfamily)
MRAITASACYASATMQPNGGGRVVTDTLTEDQLLQQLRAGDEAAYEILVRTYSGRMLSVARRLLACEEDARDAVQEAFIAAFRSLDRFEGAARVSTWLHRIVVNACLMKLRSGRRKPEESIEPLLPTFQEDGHHSIKPSQWAMDAHSALEQEERRLLVRAKIAELPDTYRTILVLRDIEGLDTDEAARMLEITTTAVKVRLHRARQALRTLLDPHFRGGVQ